MHTIYEYLLTALIIVAIVTAASTMLTSMATPLKLVSEQEQLKVTADKLMGQILLSTGVPADWGRNLTIGASDLGTFGLAKQSETTRASYVLDGDKVERLNFPVNASTLPVTPSDVRDLLQLGRDYGFALEVFPVLAVDASPGRAQADYVIQVANSEGLPIPGANITGVEYYVYNGLKNLTATGEIYKDEIGNYTLKFGGPKGGDEGAWYSDTKILGVVVEYGGTRIVQFFTGSEHGCGSNTGLFYAVGDHLFVPDSNYDPYTEVVYEVLAYRRGTASAFRNVSFPLLNTTLQPTGWTARQMSYVEPSAVAFLSFNINASGRYLLVASRGAYIVGTSGFSTIPGAERFPLGVQLQRVVTIADQSYVFRLYLWRMSW